MGITLNANARSEAAAITARMRIGYIKFSGCEELLYGKKFLLKRKDLSKCTRSTMLYGSETSCLRENKMAILRTEKVNVWS